MRKILLFALIVLAGCGEEGLKPGDRVFYDYGGDYMPCPVDDPTSKSEDLEMIPVKAGTSGVYLGEKKGWSRWKPDDQPACYVRTEELRKVRR